jgi:hypothetical protein
MLKKAFKGFVVLFSIIIIAACSAVSPDDYASEKPEFKLEEFLNGKLTGWGIFQETGGKVTKRFRIDMEASWQGNKGKFVEHFSFADGTKQVRTWDMTRIDAHNYTAVANDSVGPGNGQSYGNTIHWNYTIKTETDSGTYDLDYDYWMYMIDNNTLINRATLSKFGIPLGDIAVTFHKNR